MSVVLFVLPLPRSFCLFVLVSVLFVSFLLISFFSAECRLQGASCAFVWLQVVFTVSCPIQGLMQVCFAKIYAYALVISFCIQWLAMFYIGLCVEELLLYQT